MTRVLSDFTGQWAIARDITHAGQPPATFEGIATFAPDGGGLVYHEVGKLIMHGVAPMHSERRYSWDADLNVYFDDGRFFHTVPAQGGKTEHWCDPDQYNVTYDFDRWPVWTAKWHVSGPRKDYEMITQYQRS